MHDIDFFNSIAPFWDNMEILSTPAKINYILDRLDISDSQSVLDLGTGTGVLLPYLCSRTGEDGRITAVDFSEGMLDVARRKYGRLPQVCFVKCDFEHDDIDGHYDHILLYSVFPHLHHPARTLEKLMGRNLKPDGKIIIAFPTDETFINTIHSSRHVSSSPLPPADELTQRLRSEGFDARTIEATHDAYIIELTAKQHTMEKTSA